MHTTLIPAALWVLTGVAILIGYVMNIFTLISVASAESAEVTLMFILRIIGLFIVPLGGVLGYF